MAEERNRHPILSKAKLNKWLDDHAHLLDERKLVLAANAKRLPNGEFGLVELFLNGHNLDVYDVDICQNLGERLYSIDLREISELKTCGVMFFAYLKFNYRGYKYKFVDFAAAKDFLQGVYDSAGIEKK